MPKQPRLSTRSAESTNSPSSCASSRPRAYRRKASAAGRGAFTRVGCTLCHTPALKTGNSSVAGLRNQWVNLYSDLLVHDMGPELADGISQGQAGPSEFRTAPLWGLGHRIFFLHDGRTSDLEAAIGANQSGSAGERDASEANALIDAFNTLPETAKQNLLNFLRSL